jgi:glycosyltransferase involved in cell wall biosynthesis
MDQLQDGRTNVLFVGRIAPNKKQDDLVRAFQYYLVHDHSARLILVGALEDNDPYAAMLKKQINGAGLGKSVIMTGSVSDSQLAAYYRTATLLWSMSEHEGFCVPLVEAMWFDVPVLAFRSTAVPETLGSAAMLFAAKGELREIAGVAHLLVIDTELRQKIIAAQRKRRAAFLPKVIEADLLRTISGLRTKSTP